MEYVSKEDLMFDWRTGCESKDNKKSSLILNCLLHWNIGLLFSKLGKQRKRSIIKRRGNQEFGFGHVSYNT